jgi:hypothetical protein
MTSEGLGEMFEDEFAEMYAEKFPLMSGTDSGTRTPIGVSGNKKICYIINSQALQMKL